MGDTFPSGKFCKNFRKLWERVTHWKSYSEFFSRDSLSPLKKLHGKVTSASFLPWWDPPSPLRKLQKLLDRPKPPSPLKKFLSNFFNGWNVTGSPQRKNVHTLNLRTSDAQFGAMNLWEDSVHHEIIARFIIFHMSASKNQIFCIFLHTIIFEIMH